MEEIEINIPKLSLFKDEKKLFTDLLSYLSALGNLFRGRNSANMEGMEKYLMREKEFVESVHHDNIERVIYALQMIVSSNNVHEQQKPILSAEFLSGCRHDKRNLQKMKDKYQQQMMKVRECQQAVWISGTKVQKYGLMVFAAESSIQFYAHDEGEFRKRNKAAEQIKKDFAVRMKSYTTNTIVYEKAVSKANVLRKGITTLSASLQEQITEKMNNRINNLMGKNENENAGISYTQNISKVVYKLLSHSFSVIQPPSDCTSRDFYKVIPCHDIVRYMFNSESIEKVMNIRQLKKHASGDVFDEVNQPIQDLHKLDAGDKDQNRIDMEKEQMDCRTETVKPKPKKGLFLRIKERISGKYYV